MSNKGDKTLIDNISSGIELKVDINDTVSYKQKFIEYKGAIYELYKIGNEEWKARKTPFNELPYTYFTD